MIDSFIAMELDTRKRERDNAHIMTIQKIIKALIDSGYSQVEIAAETSVGQSRLSDLLRGRRKDIAYSSGKRIEEFARKKCPQLFRAKKKTA